MLPDLVSALQVNFLKRSVKRKNKQIIISTIFYCFTVYDEINYSNSNHYCSGFIHSQV